MSAQQPWIDAALESMASYRRLIGGAIAQLSDDEIFRPPTDQANSIAVILRHLGGNLHSRWTDFLTSDGEKPNRDRDAEFRSWEGDRASLIAYLDEGWRQMTTTVASLTPTDMQCTVTIRGESHTVPQAILRSITHLAYHVGQIMMVARTVHQGDWNWLTIAPGQSRQHNDSTWGTGRSRGIAGEEH